MVSTVFRQLSNDLLRLTLSQECYMQIESDVFSFNSILIFFEILYSTLKYYQQWK